MNLIKRKDRPFWTKQDVEENINRIKERLIEELESLKHEDEEYPAHLSFLKGEPETIVDKIFSEEVGEMK